MELMKALDAEVICAGVLTIIVLYYIIVSKYKR
jgi:hypothetical protein